MSDHSRLGNNPSPSNQYRTPAPARAMAHQPPTSHSIHRRPTPAMLLHPGRRHVIRPYVTLIGSISKPRHSTPNRFKPSIITRGSSNRRHAAWAIHDRKVPHRQTISIQSSSHPKLVNRRRSGANQKRIAKCDGLARDPGHLPKNEELHSNQVCFLLAVSCYPIHPSSFKANHPLLQILRTDSPFLLHRPFT